MILCQITAPHFVAGIDVRDNSLVVEEAAPIISYMTGWHLKRVLAYCKKKDWSIEKCQYTK